MEKMIGEKKVNYHQLDLQQIFLELKTTEQGLSKEQAEERFLKYGANEIKKSEEVSAWEIFFGQFKSTLVIILLAATLVSALIGETVDALIIFAIVIINAFFGFIQEYKADKAIEALKKMAGLKSKVMRGGKQFVLDASELTIGDIIFLDTGDKVPADARIIQSVNLEVQESILTGESLSVLKVTESLNSEITALGDLKNMLFSGTIITKGRGMAVVVAIGMGTEIGKIAKMISETGDKKTNLEKKLDGLTRWLGVITLIICLILFLTYFFIRQFPLHEAFLTAVALAVAAIPEGLPAVVTISLGLGVKRFVQKNALVRRLSSVETLGSVSVICTDKTGTLTKNEMMVTKLWVDNDIIDVTGNGYELVGSFSDNPARFLRLLEIGMLANNSKLEDGKIIGDPTEGALIVSAKKGGLDEHHLSQKYTRHAEIPFDSERKMMSSVYHQGAEGATKILFSKGAIESLLPRCTHILLNGKEIIFTDDKKNEILAIAEKFSTGALRVLAFAYGHGEEEQNLIFVGLQAMMDPPREEAKHAIEKCKEAGIRVVMITGDNLITAQAIGEQLGIHGKAMLGADFEKIENKAAIIDEIGIFARVNPAHKQIIVNLLQAEGNVVAMTGDGVNDAPALKMADIGVSMGITGTDVAKQSSDMILIDDNFASIVNAVEEGRGIYDNIQKFVGYLLASNIGEILIVFVASLLGLPLPLLAIHLLLINLITDGLPAIALGIDPINPLVMKRKPRKSSEFILDRRMIANIGFLSCLMAAGVLAIFIQFYQLDLEIARTASLVLIVLMELVKIWVIRSQYGLSFFSNKWLIAAIAFSLCFVLLITYSPLYSFFELKPFGMEIWREIIGILSILALLGGVSNHFFFRKI